MGRRCGPASPRRAADFVVMGDADDSYDFSRSKPFVEALRGGCDLVMGNRFRGGIAPGAMPWLHRYLGNPVLSFIGQRFFGGPLRDFHCGLRGLRRQAVLDLELVTPGMEFASEMIIKALLAQLRIAEVPTTLRQGRSRPPAAPAHLARRLAPPALPAALSPRAGCSSTPGPASRCWA